MPLKNTKCCCSEVEDEDEFVVVTHGPLGASDEKQFIIYSSEGVNIADGGFDSVTNLRSYVRVKGDDLGTGVSALARIAFSSAGRVFTALVDEEDGTQLWATVPDTNVKAACSWDPDGESFWLMTDTALKLFRIDADDGSTLVTITGIEPTGIGTAGIIAADDDGTVISTAHGAGDAAFAIWDRYDDAGTLINSADVLAFPGGTYVSIDGNGDVWVTGFENTANPITENYLYKFSATGTLLSKHHFGNIVLKKVFVVLSTDFLYVGFGNGKIGKYNRSLVEQWLITWGGDTSKLRDLAVGTDGVYVCGAATFADAALIQKLSLTDGSEIWQSEISLGEDARAVACSPGIYPWFQ